MIRRYPGLRALALVIATVAARARWEQVEQLTKRWLLRQERYTAYWAQRARLAAFCHSHQRALV